MKYKILLNLLASWWIVSTASAVTITVQGGGFFESDGTTLVSVGSLGVLVVDTAGDGFLSLAELDGFAVTQNTFWGDDDYLLAVMPAADGIPGFFNTDLPNINYGVGLSEGDKIGFYWFPELDTPGASLSPALSWGFYRNDAADEAVGGSIGFTLPVNDTSALYLAFFTPEFSGVPEALGTIAAFTAMPGVSPVPEPSTYAALFGVVGLVFAARRRRRSRPGQGQSKTTGR